MHLPLKERRQLLQKHVVEISNEVMHSEQYELESETEVKALMVRVMKEGLEGLVFKDAHSVYEPGERCQHPLAIEIYVPAPHFILHTCVHPSKYKASATGSR